MILIRDCLDICTGKQNKIEQFTPKDHHCPLLETLSTTKNKLKIITIKKSVFFKNSSSALVTNQTNNTKAN